jgi:4-alpha-glucanotransferase
MDAVVNSLAELYGIETSFEDARGETQHASPESIRKVLAAMDVEIRSERQTSALVAELQVEEWSRALPPVRVFDLTRGAPEVEITLPPQHGPLSWTLRKENGETTRGRVTFEELRLTGRRTVNGERVERRSFTLSAGTPSGYHEFSLEAPRASMSLIVSPGRCYLPPEALRRRWWGIAAQLYAVRSKDNWGIGDFSDLRQLIRITRDRGGEVVGVNPLHALFLERPAHASPYSPLSRLLLNVLNVDITRVSEFEYSDKARDLVSSVEFSQRLEACRASENIDYEGVTQLKRSVLRLLFETFQVRADRARAAAFDAFRRAQPEGFQHACVFQVMRDLGREEYEHAGAPGMELFRSEQSALIDEIVWYQWIADEQLAAAAQEAASMAIGIYRDLAVGSDGSGAERWANPAGFARAHIGAPSDVGNPAGQDWGLPAPHPRSMRAQSYRPFIELLRANMRHAGALRIDHAMALQHLFWIPEGATPKDGAYVKYPMEDLLGILALESHRNRCLVIGEDLGTVPPGFRERMAHANILSYKVLYFEKDNESGAFPDAAAYPGLSLAVAASHDLPTLAAWWQGADIDLRQRLCRFDSEEEQRVARAERQKERELLAKTLGLADGTQAAADDVIRAAHAFLAGTPAVLAMAQLDDITREIEPVNVPGTCDEYPNWRHRYSIKLEALLEDSLLRPIADRMNQRRTK